MSTVRVPGPNDPLRALTEPEVTPTARPRRSLDGNDLDLADVPAENEAPPGVGVAYRPLPEELLREQFEPRITENLLRSYERLQTQLKRQKESEERQLEAMNLHNPGLGESSTDPQGLSGPRAFVTNYDWRSDLGIPTATASSATTTTTTTTTKTASNKKSSPPSPPQQLITPPPSSLVRRTRSKSRGGTRVSASRSSSRPGTTVQRKSSRTRSPPMSQRPSQNITRELASMKARERPRQLPLLTQVANLARRSGQPQSHSTTTTAAAAASATEAAIDGDSDQMEEDAYRELEQIMEQNERRLSGKDREDCFLCTCHQYFIGLDNVYLFFRHVLDDISVRMSYEPEPVLNACADFFRDFRNFAAEVGIQLPEMDQSKWLEHLVSHAQSPEAIRYRVIQMCLANAEVLGKGILLAARLNNGNLAERFDINRTKGFALMLNQLHKWTAMNPSQYNIRSQSWVNAQLDPKRSPTLILQARNDPNAMPMIVNATDAPVSMQMYQGLANRGNKSLRLAGTR